MFKVQLWLYLLSGVDSAGAVSNGTGAVCDAAQSIEQHRKLGESIAIWQNGKIVVLTADQLLTHERLK
jgi:hypothetical protein